MPSGANDCIPYFEPADEITGHCTAVVRGKRFVSPSAHPPGGLIGVENIQIAESGAGAKAVGIAAYDGVLNEEIPLKTGNGVYPMTSGAAVAFGQEVQSDAQGRAIPLAAGRANGIAVETVAGADLDVGVKLYS